MERVLDVVNRIEDDNVLSLDEAKGITGRSLFLDIPYFNFVLHVPAEYLHSTCLGVVKRMFTLTFQVGDIRARNTIRKLTPPATLNKKMCEIKVPRECSRRIRALVFSVMKGQEFRNYIILFFPVVVSGIEESAKERRVWLLLAYMIRLCVLPEEEYQMSDPEIVRYCGTNFYNLYEKLFHARNCTYYTHVAGSHMPEMRALGPLTETSAFGFESFYGEMRNCFSPGTNSPLKQIMQKVLLKRTISPH